MPFRPDRLKELREAKGLSQEQLERLSGLSHSAISKSEKGRTLPGSEVLDKLTRALDCTMDYLHERGPVYATAARAASYMSLDVASQFLTEEQIERCRRVLPHADAPKTADQWRSLAEMLAMAYAPTATPPIEHPRPKSKPMAVARQRLN